MKLKGTECSNFHRHQLVGIYSISIIDPKLFLNPIKIGSYLLDNVHVSDNGSVAASVIKVILTLNPVLVLMIIDTHNHSSKGGQGKCF